jgi:hypothetical protein
VCLAVPVIRPTEFEDTHAVQQRDDAREFRQGPP